MHPEDFLTLDEWHRLLAAAPAPRDAALLWLMSGCGLRVSEVAALKVEHLDGPGGYLHVVDGKGGKQRTSILPKPVLDALQAHLNGLQVGLCLPRPRSWPYLYLTDPEAVGLGGWESKTAGENCWRISNPQFGLFSD